MRLALRLALLALAGQRPAGRGRTRSRRRLATLSRRERLRRAGPTSCRAGLAAADLARYRQIFALQRQRDWAERRAADRRAGGRPAARPCPGRALLSPRSRRAPTMPSWRAGSSARPTCRRHRASTSWRWAASPRARPEPRAPEPVGRRRCARALAGRASRLGAPARSPPPPTASPAWPTTPGSIRPPRRAPRSGPHAPICAPAGRSWWCRCCGSRPKAATSSTGRWRSACSTTGSPSTGPSAAPPDGMLDLLVRYPGDPAGRWPWPRWASGSWPTPRCGACAVRAPSDLVQDLAAIARTLELPSAGPSRPGARGPTRKPPRLPAARHGSRPAATGSTPACCTP